MVLELSNIHEHRSKSTYASYTFQPLMVSAVTQFRISTLTYNYQSETLCGSLYNDVIRLEFIDRMPDASQQRKSGGLLVAIPEPVKCGSYLKVTVNAIVIKVALSLIINESKVNFEVYLEKTFSLTDRDSADGNEGDFQQDFHCLHYYPARQPLKVSY